MKSSEVSFITTQAAILLHGDWRTLFRANGIYRWVKRFRATELSDGRIRITCELSSNH